MTLSDAILRADVSYGVRMQVEAHVKSLQSTESKMAEVTRSIQIKKLGMLKERLRDLEAHRSDLLQEIRTLEASTQAEGESIQALQETQQEQEESIPA